MFRDLDLRIGFLKQAAILLAFISSLQRECLDQKATNLTLSTVIPEDIQSIL